MFNGNLKACNKLHSNVFCSVYWNIPGADRSLTEGPEGPLVGHQGEEPGLQCVGDDDVKQILVVLPVAQKEDGR